MNASVQRRRTLQSRWQMSHRTLTARRPSCKPNVDLPCGESESIPRLLDRGNALDLLRFGTDHDDSAMSVGKPGDILSQLDHPGNRTRVCPDCLVVTQRHFAYES